MARHVFQYDRWNPPIGMYISDPYALDPLERVESRPQVAYACEELKCIVYNDTRFRLQTALG
jgi:hypothetical protein